MPEPQEKKCLSKRQIQAICGGVTVVLVLALLILIYPWLQLQLAEQLITAGKYDQAESILSGLMASKPQLTEAGFKLIICQLAQGKGREAAQTLISLTDSKSTEDLDIAIVFTDVAKHLWNTGNGEAAVELAKRVGAQHKGEMLEVAIKEMGFLIGEYSDLPLALDAIDLALSHGENNWLTNQKAFNLLLTKALESSPVIGEPALDRALQLYPNNIIAVTRKASLIGDKNGPQKALEYLNQKESELEDNLTPEYLTIKRTLLIRLALADPKAELTQYTRGMPREMLVEIAQHGLNYAWQHSASGRQYYYLVPDEPKIAYQYGRNLFQMRLWVNAREIFKRLEEMDPNFMDFKAVYAALDSKEIAKTKIFSSEEASDTLQISPDGQWLAWRKWQEHPQEHIMVSDLVLTNLSFSNNKSQSLGDVILFKWSPDSKYLALQTISDSGIGRLSIFSIEDELHFFLPAEYDVIDFNWANKDIMVQAQRDDQMYLLHMSPPEWVVKKELVWKLSSNVNQNYSWLTTYGKSLVVHRYNDKDKIFYFNSSLLSFTSWSPNGNLAIMEDMDGKSWIYNQKRGNITPIELSGKFAAWGQNQDFFWLLPVWDELHILTRLNGEGKVQEYCPYSFDMLYYDISITANGDKLILMEENKIFITTSR